MWCNTKRKLSFGVGGTWTRVPLGGGASLDVLVSAPAKQKNKKIPEKLSPE